VFRAAVWLQAAGRKLQAGEYRFDTPLTPAEVVQRIVRGDVYLQPVTFREGLTIREMAAVFEERGFGPRAAFFKAAADASSIRELDPQARDLEGYLFPDTYALPRHTTAEEAVERMVGRFERALTPEIKEQAAARGLSVRELVTLASLVEKETAKPEERPLVAAVYLNRLKIGMGLQCDPTVIYALERAGRYAGNLTRDDLRFDSPYNTLPVRRIARAPSRRPVRPLQASANPPTCTSFREPERRLPCVRGNAGGAQPNVQEYQVRYFRDKRFQGSAR
jgi:UPF0755 protein